MKSPGHEGEVEKAGKTSRRPAPCSMGWTAPAPGEAVALPGPGPKRHGAAPWVAGVAAPGPAHH